MTWEGISTLDEYRIISYTGDVEVGIAKVSSSPYHIPTTFSITGYNFNDINNSDRIGIVALDSTSTPTGDITFAPVPELLPLPTLTVERLGDNSLKVSWSNSHNSWNAVFITEDGSDNLLYSGGSSDMSSTYTTSDPLFDRVNNAQRIGIGSSVNGEFFIQRLVSVPAEIAPPSVTAERLDDNSLKVTWENIRTELNFYAIFITDTNIPSFAVPSDTSELTFDPSHPRFDEVNNAQKIGVSGTIGSLFIDQIFVTVPELLPLPTLTVDRLDDNSLTVSWSNSHNDRNAVFITKGDINTILDSYRASDKTYTYHPWDYRFDQINNADRIGVGSYVNDEFFVQVSEPVPELKLIVTAKRLADTSLKVSWENLRPSLNYNIFTSENGDDFLLAQNIPPNTNAGTFTFSPLHDKFDQIQRAVLIGVIALDHRYERVDDAFVSVPGPFQLPTLTVERLDDNSLKVSWMNSNNDLNAVFITEDGSDYDILTHAASNASITFAPSHPNFNRINNADRIGIGSYNESTFELVVQKFVSVPELLPLPTLTVERLIDNSLKVSWSNSHNARNAVFITEDGSDNVLDSDTTSTTSYTYTSSDPRFDQINNAQRIGVGSFVNDEFFVQVFEPVPAQRLPDVSAERQADNSILVTWENIPTLDEYRVSSFVGGIGTEIALSSSSPHTILPSFTTAHNNFESINNSERIGVIGVDSSNNEIGDYSFAPVPSLLPSVSAERQADNSILVTWENIDTDSTYSIFAVKDNVAVLVQSMASSPITFYNTHANFDRINNADRISVSGVVVSTAGTPGYAIVPDEILCTNRVPVEQCLTAERLADNSILVTWENIPTSDRYLVSSYTGDAGVGIARVSSSPHIISYSYTNTGHNFEDINNSDRISVTAIDSNNNEIGDHSFAPVPSLNPYVTAVRQADNSIKLTWDGIPTSDGYHILSLTGGIEVAHLKASSSPYTIPTSYSDPRFNFNYINNSDEIGVVAVDPTSSPIGNAEFTPVPAQVGPEPSVTAVRQTDNSILVTWENIPTSDSYIVSSYTGDIGVGIAKVSSSSHIIATSYTTIHNNFDDVNNSDRIGVVAVDSTSSPVGDVEFAPVPAQVVPVPPITAERQPDNSILVTWENMPTSDRYRVSSFVGGIGTEIVLSSSSPYTILPSFTTTHNNFENINNSDRIGVVAVDSSNNEIGDYSFAPVPSLLPSVTAERLNDNSILVSWENIPTPDRYRVMALIDDRPAAIALASSSPYLIPTTFSVFGYNFNDISNSEGIGIVALGPTNRPVGDTEFALVPEPLPLPTLTVERLIDNSLKVSWSNSHNDRNAVFITEGSTDNVLDSDTASTTSYTYTSSDPHFDQINNAQRIGVGSYVGDEFFVQVFEPVPAQRLPDVSAVRQTDDSILVTWENIPTSDRYRVSSFVGDVRTEIALSSSSPYTILPSFTTVHNNFENVNNSNRIGVIAIDSSNDEIGNHEFTPVPPLNPIVTVERLDDNSLKVTWENIRSTTDVYALYITEDGADDVLVQRGSSTNTYTFTSSHEYFEQINNAEEIGVAGFINIGFIDHTFEPVPPLKPIVTVQRLADNSILLSWEGIRNTDDMYNIFITENGVNDFLFVHTTPTDTSYHITPLSLHFDRINNAERIGVYGYVNNVLVDQRSQLVPPIPSVTVERLDDNSLKVTWVNIRTDNNFYDIRITETGSDIFLFRVDSTETEYTFGTGNLHFNRVNDAQRIGISGNIDGERVDERFMAVPPLKPIVTAIRLDDNSIKVTWANIYNTFVAYDIFLTENGGDNFLYKLQGQQYTFTTLDSVFDRVSDAQRIGVSGIEDNRQRGDTTFTPIPEKIPLPTLTVERLDDNSIEVSWSDSHNPRNAIFITELDSDNVLDSSRESTMSYTFTSPDSIFERINSAERIGVGSYVNGEFFVQRHVPVPPLKLILIPERLSDNSLKLSWENIDTTDRVYNVIITEDGEDNEILLISPVTDEYIIAPWHPHFDRVNNAERIGVYGIVDDARSDLVWTPIPELLPLPTLIVQRLDDNSLRVYWNNSPNDITAVFITESDIDNVLDSSTASVKSYTYTPSHPNFDRINSAERIGIGSYTNSELGVQKFVPVPAQAPLVASERFSDNSLKLSWENIDTTNGVYNIRITESSNDNTILEIPPSTSEFTFPPSHEHLDRINNAERIGVYGTVDGIHFEQVWATIPELFPLPTLIVQRLDNNSIEVSWDNSPNTVNAIFITKDGTNTVLHSSSHSNTIFVFHPSNDDFDLVNNADRIGIGSYFDFTLAVQRYEPIPPQASTLTTERLLGNHIQLTWELIHSDHGEYNIWVTENGVSEIIGDSIMVTGNTYTILSSPDTDFTRINLAQRVGISGVSDTQGEEDRAFADIPRTIAGLISERLPDNSIRLEWGGARSDIDSYNVIITEVNVDLALDYVVPGHTLIIPTTHEHFKRINDAERVGIAGILDGVLVDPLYAVLATLNPTVTAERLADDSIIVEWDDIRTTGGFYNIRITESGTDTDTLLRVPSNTSEFTFTPLHEHFERVSNAEEIGIAGNYNGGYLDELLVPVPASILPFLKAERLADDSILVTWKNIHSPFGPYFVHIIKDGIDVESYIAESNTRTHTIPISDPRFEQINNADEIGVSGFADNGGEQLELVNEQFVPVPPSILPILTAERLDDNSIKLIWKNIRSDNNFYDIGITESNTDTNPLVSVSSDTSEFTFTPLHEHFERVSNAERVGISGTVDGKRVDQKWVPVPPLIIPSIVTAERLADGSILLTWEGIRSPSDHYEIVIAENGVDYSLPQLFRDSPYILPSSDSRIDRVNNAEKIGISGLDINDEPVDLTFTAVPPPPVHSISHIENNDGTVLLSLTAAVKGLLELEYDGKQTDETIHDGNVNTEITLLLQTNFGYLGDVVGTIDGHEVMRYPLQLRPAPPTLIPETITATSIVLSWDAPRSATEYVIYEDGKELTTVSGTTYLHTGLTPNTEYTYTAKSTYSTKTSTLSAPLPVTTASLSVGDLSFSYNEFGNTLASFIPSEAGQYTISYITAGDETAVDSVTADVSQVNVSTTATLLTDFGYVGEVTVSFASTEYARGDIAVPPAPPVLVAGDITKNSITITWDAPRSATEYLIYENRNLIDTIPDTTFTHSGLSIETEYTYTVESRYDGIKSTLSAPLTLSTDPPSLRSISLDYNIGNTIVSFIPLESGEFTINYITATDETAVDSVPITITPEQVGDSTMVRLLTDFGYTGEVTASFDGVDYASASAEVPPAPPTLIPETITATSIVLSWDAPRSATEYVIYEDGKELTTVSGTTYLHTGLTPNTEYTYTAKSTYSTKTSTLSAPLPVTTASLSVGDLSFSYNEFGNTLASFIPSEAGQYTISYITAGDETAVDSVTADVSQVNVSTTATLLTDFGYTGIVTVSFASTEYARGDIAVPPAPPTLVAGDITKNSIEITWDAPRSATEYLIYENSILIDTIPDTTFTHSGLSIETEYTYTVESRYDGIKSTLSAPLILSTDPPSLRSISLDYNIGNTIVSFIPLESGEFTINYITATDETAVDSVPITITPEQVDGSTMVRLLTDFGYTGEVTASFDGVNYASASAEVPPAPPTLIPETITATSIVLSWDAPRSATEYVIYEDGKELTTVSGTTYLHTGLTPNTEYTYTAKSTYSTKTSTLSAPLPVTTASLSVGDLSFSYNESGNTLASFIPSEAGEYTISYITAGDETAVDSVTADVSQVNVSTTATLLTDFGYTGIVTVSFASTEYARGDIAVPPAPPVLVAGDITKNSITITWDAPRSATEYLIYENSILIDTIPDTTFTHSGLSIETEYTYTVESRYDGIKSTLSAPLTLSTDPPSLRSISLDYNIGNTIVSFIPLESGEFTINYITATDETAVDSVPITITPEQVGDSTMVRLLTDFGYTGEVTASFDGVDYASASAEVPPAPPTLIPETITATSIVLSWDAPRSATEYVIYEDGKELTTVSGTTYLHTGLTPNTEYTYTAKSTYSTKTSTLSIPLPLTTASLSVGDLSFSYNEFGNTLASFIPSEAGEYTISYITATDETAVDSVTADVSQVNVSTTATLLTDFGYVGEVTVSFASTEYARGDIAVPPAPPALVAGDITKNSIEITWDAPRSATEYLIYENSILIDTIPDTTFTHSGLSIETEYTYTVESRYDGLKSTLSAPLTLSTDPPSLRSISLDYNIGNTIVSFIPLESGEFTINYITATDETAVDSVPITITPEQVGDSTMVRLLTDFGYTGEVTASFDGVDYASASAEVPPAPPTLIPETITATSIVLSWDAPRSATEYVIYEDGKELTTVSGTTYLHTGLTPNTEYTYTAKSTYSTKTSTLSAPLPVTTASLSVGDLSFSYNEFGNTLASFIPSEAGEYTISYITAGDETAVDSVTADVSQVNVSTTATLLTDFGYVGEVTVSFASTEYARGDIAVPPAPPVLVAGDITKNSIEITWDAPRSATEYLIYENRNLIDTIPDTTFTHSGLSIETEYTYTVESRYDGIKSTLSAPLTLSTDPPSLRSISLDYNTSGNTLVSFIPLESGEFTINYITATDETAVDSVPITITPEQVGDSTMVRLLTDFGYTGEVTASFDGVDYASASAEVPPAPPTLIPETITATSIVLSWDAPRSATEYVIYEDGKELTTVSGTTYLHTGLTPNTEYTYTAKSTYSTKTSTLSIPLPVTTASLSVGDLSFSYNEFGNTLASFIPSEAGQYTISYITAGDETAVDSVTADVSQVNVSTTATLLTDFGYVGEVTVSFASTEYARGDIAVPPAPPVLVAGDITKNSIEITWDAPRSATEYLIYENRNLIDTIPDTTFTHSGLSIETEYTYTVESRYDGLKSTLSAPLTLSTDPPSLRSISLDYNIGNTIVSFIPLESGEFTINYITATDETAVDSVPITITPEQVGDSTMVRLLTDFGYTGEVTASFDGVDYASASAEVPPAPPTLIPETITATSIVLSWDAPRSATEYVIYEDGKELTTVSGTTYLHTGLTPNTEYTYTAKSTYSTKTSTLSAPLPVTTASLSVGDLSFSYNEFGNTLASFIPSEAGQYTISYITAGDETAVDSVTADVSQVNVSTTATLLTDFGYVGEVTVSFASTEYARGDIAVPPAPPVLVAGDITKNSITITWDAPRSATEYLIYENSILIDTIPDTTFTHSGLSIETEYTYTVESRYDGLKSTLSAPLTLSTDPPSLRSISLDYNIGNTIVSFIPLESGEFTINYITATDETAVDSVPITITPEQVGDSTMVRLLTDFGYTGEVTASFDGVDYASASAEVPPAPPTLIPETITATSIVLSWDAPRSATEYVIYEDGKELTTVSGTTYLHTGLTPNTEYTYTAKSTYSTKTSTLSIPLPVTTASLSVGDLSFSYNEFGNTLASFIPSEAGEYTISYITATDETAVDSVTADVSQVNVSTTATLLTDFGYVGEVTVSFASTEYARGDIAVPPAPPALVAGDITKNSITITWDAPRSATEYLIYENSILIDTIPDTTFTHSGLSIETEYTYTVESRYDGLKSTLSAPLTLSTDPPSLRSISLDYNIGNTIVSFIPLESGEFTINYITATDETAVDSVPITITPEQVGDSTMVRLLTDFGYTGEVTASFDGVDYASASAEVPPAPPTLIPETITATSIVLSWDAPRSATEYVIYEDGKELTTVSGTTYLHTGLTPNTEYTYTAKSTYSTKTSTLSIPLPLTTASLSVGDLSFSYNEFGNTLASFIPSEAGQYTISYITAGDETAVDSVTADVSQVNVSTTATLLTDFGYTGIVTVSFASTEYNRGTIAVPPAPPTLISESITKDSITITWAESRSATEYLIYENGNLLDTVSTTSFTHSGLTLETEYTYTAESRYNGIKSTLSDSLTLSTGQPSLREISLAYDMGNTLVSFIPLESGEYTISYITAGDETAVDSVPIDVLDSQVNGSVTATLQTNFGYVGIATASFDNTEYARETASVPPAPPTLRAEDTTATSIIISWDEPRSATSYELFRDGTSIAEPTGLTFTDTGLAPATDYIYTAKSTYGTKTSTLSAPLTLSTIATPVTPVTPEPSVTAERLADNSILLTWENIRTNELGLYNVWITEGGIDKFLSIVVSGDTYTILPSEGEFARINNAEKIGIGGNPGGIDLRLVPVPAQITSVEPVDPETPVTPLTSYVSGRIMDDDSIKVTWSHIPTGKYHLHTEDAYSVPDETKYFHLERRDNSGIETFDFKHTIHDDPPPTVDTGRICIYDPDEDSVSPTPIEMACGQLLQSGGNSNDWETKPTFGKDWNTYAQLIDTGFVFNGIPLTITNNWHTDFNLTSSIIGENNTIHIKGFAPNDFKSVTLSLGIPEVGKKYDAESHITLSLNRNYTNPSDYQVMEIHHDQKDELVNESITGATLSKVKCMPTDENDLCLEIEISFTIMAPLTGEVIAISATDNEYRETVTFINQGVEFVGDSLLESQTHVLTQKYSNQHPVETIELTQLDRRYQIWEDQNGYLWTQNEYGSWLQITVPDITPRDDPTTSVMTRAHSNFANLVTQEQNRAALIFNSSSIQGIPDEPFTHDMPIRLERLSDPELLEILHIQALLAEELLCDCILFDAD